MDPPLPCIGTRISLSGSLGTVRYVGSVSNTSGTWLGVEWDSPIRGKHNGIKDGKQYFTCRFETSGSFIRPSPHIHYGVSFLEALSAKYIEALHGDRSQEKVVLGSSAGAIQVEAVDLDKIREKFSRLDRLREVSLDNECVVRGNSLGEIAQTCPNVRGLDFSQNLLPSWEVVAQITEELPYLLHLSVNRNRLQMPHDYERLPGAFRKLIELQLNDTLTSWIDMQKITSFMPELRSIEMGYNYLTRLCGDRTEEQGALPPVELINLDANKLSDWVHIWTSLKEYKSLQRVVLTSNIIENIPFPEHPSDSLPGISYLSLSGNCIRAWESIDALSCWLPALKTLTMSGNPLLSDDALEQQLRPLLIARIPSLTTLDGAAISTRERNDSELFYMSYIIRQGPLADDVRSKAHYRWKDLCQKHGTPDEIQGANKQQNKLSDHLIDVQLYRYDESLKQIEAAFNAEPETVLRVLPTMTFRVLRLKICKALKLNPRQVAITFWLRMGHGTLSSIDSQYDTRDLDWLGVENGSHIIYQIQ
ncbi:hypothetical protein D9613_003182 [Agrocybe pediades]|uniref:CAP-Gly domain-containing protein n=1 Tax=Agrocybe pediades TaxID=84607 RepID=A0A8H4QPR2_9AGAR|nr:hypothetical protein D9613_003182 [Agrocybe pediades]